MKNRTSSAHPAEAAQGSTLTITWDGGFANDMERAVEEATVPLENVILASADVISVHVTHTVHFPLAWGEPGSRVWDLYLTERLLYQKAETVRRNVSVALVSTALRRETAELARAAAEIAMAIRCAESFELPPSGQDGVARILSRVVHNLSEGVLASLAWELDQMTGHTTPIPLWQRERVPVPALLHALEEYGHEVVLAVSPEVATWLDGSDGDGGLEE